MKLKRIKNDINGNPRYKIVLCDITPSTIKTLKANLAGLRVNKKDFTATFSSYDTNGDLKNIKHLLK